ncbi:MAG TPA: hypothetical protein VKR22_13590 [Acidimicrobiales bacterium]|nr:hypothetical protein [Acidimicrobiales bacterium]
MPISLGLTLGTLAGCGSSSGPLVLGPSDSGGSFTVAHGQRVDVELPGTDWQVDLSPAFGPLQEVSSHLRSSRNSATETIVFTAGPRGGATVRARRPRCVSQHCTSGASQVVFRVMVD